MKTDGTEIPFEIRQEADGSRRIIDLLPAFLDLSNPGSKRVTIIDELDRSLHTLLTRHMIESYLSCCTPESRSQLLLTTHDALLMDQQLFRRDEIWVAERDVEGNSTLTPFSEFRDVRYDKDIRKSYLRGRLGGIPHLKMAGFFPGRCLPKKESDKT
jgi:AAA15 family ATPase/GTPase